MDESSLPTLTNYHDQLIMNMKIILIITTPKLFSPPSDFPLEDDPSTPGVSRGSCPRCDLSLQLISLSSVQLVLFQWSLLSTNQLFSWSFIWSADHVWIVCRDSGVPSDMEANYPSASIKFANIRIGEIGSTFPGGSCWHNLPCWGWSWSLSWHTSYLSQPSQPLVV